MYASADGKECGVSLVTWLWGASRGVFPAPRSYCRIGRRRGGGNGAAVVAGTGCTCTRPPGDGAAASGGVSRLAVPIRIRVVRGTCPFPSNAVVVQAFHGGLLGDPQVRQVVEDCLAGDSNVSSSQELRSAAQVISAAAAAWRMPMLHPVCPGR